MAAREWGLSFSFPSFHLIDRSSNNYLCELRTQQKPTTTHLLRLPVCQRQSAGDKTTTTTTTTTILPTVTFVYVDDDDDDVVLLLFLSSTFHSLGLDKEQSQRLFFCPPPPPSIRRLLPLLEVGKALAAIRNKTPFPFISQINLVPSNCCAEIRRFIFHIYSVF